MAQLILIAAVKYITFLLRLRYLLEELQFRVIIKVTSSHEIDMTLSSQNRRTRITPPSQENSSDFNRNFEQRDELGMRCRGVFERLRPTLIETHYNWHIAIDPDTEQYLIDPTLKGVTQKIRDVYGETSEVKLTIFRLNDTGTCGRI